MSYADQGKSHSERQGAEPLAGLSGVADEIKQLLSTLAGEIEDSKRVQRQALGQIEARLTRIEGEARADAGRAFTTGRRNIAAVSGPGAPEPWDLDTAEALTKSYEARDPGFVTEPPYRATYGAHAYPKQDRQPPHMQAAHGVADLERAWLGHRITDFTQRIKRSFAEMRPGSSLIALEERIDQFQKRIALALDDVARRSDVDGLRRIEAQVGELGSKLGLVQSQLSRVDGIENNLSTVMDRLSDDRLHELAAQYARGTADLETVARFAAEETHARLADAGGNSDADDARFEELRAAIEDSIAERRMGERQAMTMLDTMQEALIQILDRIEAIEHATRAQNPALAKTRGLYDPASELAHDRAPKAAPSAMPTLTVDARDLDDADVANGYWSELNVGGVRGPSAQAPLQSSFRPADPLSSADGLDSEKSQGLSVMDKLRLDLIADAQRAKLKAAASRAEQSTLKVAARRPQIGARLSAWVGAQAVSGAGKLLGTSAKVVVSALILAAAVSGALIMSLLHEPDAKVAHATKATASALGAKGDRRTAPRIAQDQVRAPEAVIQGLGFETGEDWPRNGAMQVPPSALIQEAPAPISGKSNAPGRDEEASASLSDKLGAVAAKANLATLFDEQRAGIAQDTLRSPDNADGRTSALNLPPVTVGPLSLRLAAANGDPSAEFEVGVRLAEGRGTTQDLEEAVRWYQRSAARGFAQAQYRLATHLERGFGTKKDIGRARVWYLRAAEKGNVKAMHNLAVLSASSEQTSPDYAVAGKWFTTAAEHGLADSQYNLGVLHENGLGVAQNSVLAYKWYSLAAKGGDKDAIARRDTMKGDLSAKDLAAAEDLARSFRSKDVDAIVNDARTAGEDWKRRESLDANG